MISIPDLICTKSGDAQRRSIRVAPLGSGVYRSLARDPASRCQLGRQFPSALLVSKVRWCR